MKFIVCFFLVWCSAFTIHARDIHGKVVDKESGKPLADASVTLVNHGYAVTTTIEGEFWLSALSPDDREIRVSLVGYVSQMFTIGVADTTIIIELVPRDIRVQPITVSATRATERETPVTFETLSRQDIRERYSVQDVPVLLSELPSTTYYSDGGNGIGYTYLNIRGFDARRIGVMVNGIPQNDPEDHNVYWLDFPDVTASLEDIQVQRGAGSAFYGAPAIGGSVNLVTGGTGSERRIELSAGVGSYNTRKYSASFQSGLFADRYALHARLSSILSSGYRDRSWTDFQSYFVGLVRYDDDMTTQVNFYGGPVQDHLAYYGIPKSDVKDRERRKANPILREEETERFSQPHYELLHEWRLTPSLTLNNTLFMILGEGHFDYDGTWAPFSYFRIGPQYGFPVAGDPDTLYFSEALIRATVDNTQYGWLPRLSIKHDNGDLIVGGELRIHRSEHWGRLQRVSQSPVAIPEDYRYYQYRGAKDMASLFAHEIYSLQPDVKLLFDLQYSYNQYRLYDEKFVGTDFSVPYHFLNPRVGLNYLLDEFWNTYLSVAYTQREPRLKNLYDAAEASTPASWGGVTPQFETDASGAYDFTNPLVKPEALMNVELGGAYSSAAANVSANVYWMEFTDEIVKSGQVDRFGQPITGNAERTRHIGLELSGRVAITSYLEAGGNLTLSSNTFVRHTDYSAGSPVVLDKNPIAGFPDVLGNVRLTFREQQFAVSLSGRFVGKQYTDNFRNEDNTVDPFFVSDGWMLYSFQDVVDDVDVEAKLQVNNIFDQLYASYGEGSSFFVGAERHFFFMLGVSL